MGIDFYYASASAPCRGVLLTAKALNLNLNLKPLNLQDGDHLKPEFVKINPQHCIPTMVDGDLALWESRAISTYLINKYGKGSSLYPEDPKERALIDSRLYFDIGTLYGRFGDYLYPQMLGGAPADEMKYNRFLEGVGFLNNFLEGQEYVAGKKMTVADLAIVATVSSFEALNFDYSKYPNVEKWYKNMQKSAPGYEEANGEGTKIFIGAVKHMLAK